MYNSRHRAFFNLIIMLHCALPVHIEDSTEVQHNLNTPVILPQTEILITWNPFDLLPSHAEDPSFYKVNIVLVEFDMNTGEWEDVEILASGLPNVGQANVVIPILSVRTNNNMAVYDQLQFKLGLESFLEMYNEEGRLFDCW